MAHAAPHSTIPNNFQQSSGRGYGPTYINGGYNMLGDNYGSISFLNDDPHARRSRFLDSLHFPEMNARLNNIKPTEHKTFEWVFEEDPLNGALGDLATWLKTEQGMYLVQGKPGSGKSTFFKFIFKHPETSKLLNKWAGGEDVILLFHSFWFRDSKLPRNFERFLASLIFQLVDQRPILYQECEASMKCDQRRFLDDWAQNDLYVLLLHLVTNSGSKICLFVDGLDEFAREDFDQLVQCLRDLRKGRCKLCLSSRPIDYVVQEFEGVPGLQLHELTAYDIQAYVQQTLFEKTRSMRHTVNRDDIICQLTLSIYGKADGVFLWVYYVLRNVCTGLQDDDDLQDLLKRIDVLPSNIIELYSDMWKNQNSSSIVHAAETAKLFSFAKYFPLSLYQLTVAMDDELQDYYLSQAQHADEEELSNRCRAFSKRLRVRSAGLLECCDIEIYEIDCYNLLEGWFDPDSQDKPWTTKIVGFFHRTAYEFLFETEEGKPFTQCDARWSQYHTAMSVGIAYLASFIEGYQLFDLSQIENLLEFLKQDDSELQVLDELGRFCDQIRQERLSTLKVESHNWVHGMYICDWHVDNLETWHLDSAGLRISALSSLDSVSQFLARSGRIWSGYYKGNLAITMLRCQQWDTASILSWCVDQGADLTTPHALPSRTPLFYLRSPILVALAKEYVSLLRSNGWRKDIQKIVELASFLAKYSDILEGQELTVLAHSSADCFNCFDMGLDLDRSPPLRLLVIFRAVDALEVIAGVAQEYVQSIRASQHQSTYTRRLQGPDVNALRRKAWDDFRTRVSILPKKMVYVKVDSPRGRFKFTLPSAKHAEHLNNSMFHTGPELLSCETFQGPPGGIEDTAWLRHLPSTAPAHLIQDLHVMARDKGMPAIPLDPYKDVEAGDWKRLCTMRHYFEQVESEQKGSDSGSM